MPNIKNKKQKIMILEQALKKEKKLTKKEYIRIHSLLLNYKDYTHKQIAEINSVSLAALGKWITAFNKYGVSGLRNKQVIKPSNYKLTREQKNKIKRMITRYSPKHYSLTGEFWSSHNLKQLVKEQFEVEYQSPKSYHRLLDYCGFSYQKVEFKDTRENKEYKEHEKLRLEKKLKKGVLRMYW